MHNAATFLLHVFVQMHKKEKKNCLPLILSTFLFALGALRALCLCNVNMGFKTKPLTTHGEGASFAFRKMVNEDDGGSQFLQRHHQVSLVR